MKRAALWLFAIVGGLWLVHKLRPDLCPFKSSDGTCPCKRLSPAPPPGAV